MMATPISSNTETPHALRVWDNRARLAIRGWLLAWLAILVSTILSSVFFVSDHVPARWVLGGFVASHLWVVVMAVSKHMTLRIGMVSLTHLTCWTPGWILSMLDVTGRATDRAYSIWSYAVVIAIAISFFFDLRDTVTYLRHSLRDR